MKKRKFLNMIKELINRKIWNRKDLQDLELLQMEKIISQINDQINELDPYGSFVNFKVDYHVVDRDMDDENDENDEIVTDDFFVYVGDEDKPKKEKNERAKKIEILVTARKTIEKAIESKKYWIKNKNKKYRFINNA